MIVRTRARFLLLAILPLLLSLGLIALAMLILATNLTQWVLRLWLG